MSSETVLRDVAGLIDQVLQLGGRGARMGRDSPLLGAVPEFDSMAVVSVLTAIEEHYGVTVDDDEISAETFETVGSLADFVEQKVAAEG